MSTNNSINQSNPLPFFLVRPSAALVNVTGDATIYTCAFNEIIVDNRNAYNTGTFKYTAPVQGAYVLNASVQLSGIDASMTVAYFTIKNAFGGFTNSGCSVAKLRNAANICTLLANGLVQLNVGSEVYLTVEVGGSTKTVSIDTTSADVPLSWFSGYLIR